MDKKYYVTTPIYYVNDAPHIGSAYTTLAGDIIARYYRLKLGKNNVFFLTGTDEHGQKVAQSAKEAGQTPIAFADSVVPKFKDAWKLLNINYDFFIRTTDPRHEKVASELLQKIYDAGYIYSGTYEGPYCVGCERFYKESELVDSKCPLHPNKEISHQKEKNYFLKLKELVETKVLPKLKSGKYNILPEERKNEILSRIEQGVEDVSVSREGVSWGIPVPWDKSQTIYVWVEALINYYSATQFLEGKKDFWPADLHLMAKDILWFHAVIWEALLIAADIDLPKNIFAHGFFTIDGQKISKSLGNVITPKELVDKYGVDGARYLMISAVSFGSDGDISLKSFDTKYDADLANGLGNLVSRTITLAQKGCAGKVPDIGDKNPDEHPLRINEAIYNWKKSWKAVDEYTTTFKLDEAIRSIWKFIDEANKYINTNEPWSLIGKDQEKFNWIIYGVLDSLHQIAWQINQFLPETSIKIAKALQIKDLLVKNPNFKDSWTNLKPGAEIKPIKPLFPRL